MFSCLLSLVVTNIKICQVGLLMERFCVYNPNLCSIFMYSIRRKVFGVSMQSKNCLYRSSC